MEYRTLSKMKREFPYYKNSNGDNILYDLHYLREHQVSQDMVEQILPEIYKKMDIFHRKKVATGSL